jgi:hypothetical protein
MYTPLIDVQAYENRIKELEEENKQLSALLAFADLLINKMVKERSHDTRGNPCNASR